MRAVWDLIKESFYRWIDDGAFQMSASIAFYAAFSMAPGLLIVVALVGLLYSGDTNAEIQREISSYVGEDASRLIARAVASTTAGVGVGRLATTLAITTMLIGASAVFSQLLAAMNKVWRVAAKPGRGFAGVLRDRFWPFTMVMLVSIVLLASLLLTTFIRVYSVFVNRLVPGVAFIWHYVDLGISFAVVTILFALVFKFLPDARIEWSDVWIGALVTSVFFATGKYLFSLYLGTSAIESVYGAAGSLLVILTWVYFSTSILLLGAEFTHIYAERHGHKVIPKANAFKVK
jgi:membrane protein